MQIVCGEGSVISKALLRLRLALNSVLADASMSGLIGTCVFTPDRPETISTNQVKMQHVYILPSQSTYNLNEMAFCAIRTQSTKYTNVYSCTFICPLLLHFHPSLHNTATGVHKM